VARRKIGFIVTGLVVWFGKGTVAPTLFMWTVFIHDLCMIAYAAFFLAHFVLSVMHPLMKSHQRLLFGWMPEEYVKHLTPSITRI